MAIPSSDWLDVFRENAHVFIETGTHRGDGVQAALDAGFPCIYSCDINPFDFGWSSHRFNSRQDCVHLFQEDSRAMLHRLLPEITTRSVIWLDAHYCASGAGSVEDNPLMEEIRIIKAMALLDTHTIIVDDIRYCANQEEGYPSLNALQRALCEINGLFTFSVHDSRDFPNDILVAHTLHGQRKEATARQIAKLRANKQRLQQQKQIEKEIAARLRINEQRIARGA